MKDFYCIFNLGVVCWQIKTQMKPRKFCCLLNSLRSPSPACRVDPGLLISINHWFGKSIPIPTRANIYVAGQRFQPFRLIPRACLSSRKTSMKWRPPSQQRRVVLCPLCLLRKAGQGPPSWQLWQERTGRISLRSASPPSRESVLNFSMKRSTSWSVTMEDQYRVVEFLDN